MRRAMSSRMSKSRERFSDVLRLRRVGTASGFSITPIASPFAMFPLQRGPQGPDRLLQLRNFGVLGQLQDGQFFAAPRLFLVETVAQLPDRIAQLLRLFATGLRLIE